jgi:hypothetical protein
MGRLLDSYDRLQSMPFGQWTARNSDPGLRQMTSQRRDLTSALRRGIREARKTGNAEKVLGYQNMGNSMQLQTSGISSFDQRMAGDYKFEQDTRTKMGVNSDLSERALAGVDKIGGMEPGAEGAPAAGGGERFVSRIASAPMSFADQDKARRKAVTLAGNSGAGAQRKAWNLEERLKLAAEMEEGAATAASGSPELADWRKRAKRLGVKENDFARVFNKAASFT